MAYTRYSYAVARKNDNHRYIMQITFYNSSNYMSEHKCKKYYYNYNHFTALWTLSETTWVSQHQKGKTWKVKYQSGFIGTRDSKWQCKYKNIIKIMGNLLKKL